MEYLPWYTCRGLSPTLRVLYPLFTLSQMLVIELRFSGLSDKCSDSLSHLTHLKNLLLKEENTGR